MVCPHCNATLAAGSDVCPACGSPTLAAAPAAAAPAAAAPAVPPITAASAMETARQVAAELDQARRSLPYGSIHVAAAGFAAVAVVLSFSSWGARPSWLLTILTLAGIAATGAADLRRRGAFQVAAWPLRKAHETLLAAATLVLLASTALVTLHVNAGSLLWLLSLAAFSWGVWPVLSPYAGLRPARLLGGYRALALGGAVLFLVAMTQTWGQGSSSLLPGYGYGCSFSGCGYGVNYGFGAITVYGVLYSGVAVEWAEVIVVALFLGVAALLADGAWRPAWLRFVPAATAALTALWLVWAMFDSVLVKAGSKQLSWWVAIAALAAYAAGSAFIARGQEDGDYTPARLVRRLRGEQPAS